MNYKKSYLLFLTGLIFLMATVCVKGTNYIELINTYVGEYKVTELFEDSSVKSVTKMNKEVAGHKRNVEVLSCQRELWIYDISDKDYEVLLRIVEAEAGGEDETGKILVANVV